MTYEVLWPADRHLWKERKVCKEDIGWRGCAFGGWSEVHEEVLFC